MDKKILLEHIGANLRFLRKSYGYTIKELAKRLDISEPYLRLAEKGERGISIYTVVNILDVFNVTFEELITPKNDSEQKNFVVNKKEELDGKILMQIGQIKNYKNKELLNSFIEWLNKNTD